MNTFLGLGSTGSRVIYHMAEWISKLRLDSLPPSLLVGLDTNEAVISDVRSNIQNLKLPNDIIHEFRPIGKPLLSEKITIKCGHNVEIPSSVAGGVVSTNTGAGNRRLLGLWSYCEEVPPQKAGEVWNRDSLFGQNGIIYQNLAKGGTNVYVVVGSLIGGTASGSFPQVGADMKNIAPGGVNRIAIGVLPAVAHESSVRKANAVAALRELKLQLEAGIWTHVFLVSPAIGGQEGRFEWLVEDETSSFEALLWMLGLALVVIDKDGGPRGASGANLPQGIYSLGINGKYFPLDELRDAAALKSLLDIVGKNSMTGIFGKGGYTTNYREFLTDSMHKLDVFSIPSLASKASVESVIKEGYAPAINRKEKQDIASNIFRNAWEKLRAKLRGRQPAGLYHTIRDTVDIGWYKGVIKESYEKVWQPMAKNYGDYSVVQSYLKHKHDPFVKGGRFLGVNIEDDFWNRELKAYVLHQCYNELNSQSKDILSRIELLKNRIERDILEKLRDKVAVSIFPKFKLSNVGLFYADTRDMDDHISNLSGSFRPDQGVTEHFLTLFDSAFPGSISKYVGAASYYDEVAQRSLAEFVSDMKNYIKSKLPNLKDIPAVSARDLSLPSELIERVGKPPVPVNVQQFSGPNIAVSIAYFNADVLSLRLFKEDKPTQDELMSLNTFNATRYPYSLLPEGSRIVPQNPQRIMGLLWKELAAVWENFGGILRVTKIKSPFHILIAKDPVEMDGEYYLRIYGLPETYLKLQLDESEKDDPENYALVKTSGGVVWAWGINTLLPVIEGLGQENDVIEEIRKFFV